jgi:hypothetical protein
MNHPQTIHTLNTAAHFGGSFIKQLAFAALLADPSNRGRVLAAFPEIEDTYGPMTAFYSEALG